MTSQEGIPLIIAGKVVANNQGWVSVRFANEKGEFITIPQAVVTGTVEYRSGELKKTSYREPEFAIKKTTADTPWTLPIPGKKTDIIDWPSRPDEPELQKIDLRAEISDRAELAVKEAISNILGSWGDNWLAQQIKGVMRGVLCRFARKIGYVVGWVLEKIVWPAIDNGLTSAMDKSVGFAKDSIDNFKAKVDANMLANMKMVDQMRDAININIKSAIDDTLNKFGVDLNTNVTKAIMELNGRISDSVGRSLTNLYDSMGIPEGQLMSPAQIDTITDTGFRFYSLGSGTTLNYTAMSAVVRHIADISPPVKDDDDGGIPFPFPPMPPMGFLPPI